MPWIEMSDGDITLTRLDSPEAWEAFHVALCADMELYDVATGYARVISYQSLQEDVQRGIVCAWKIVRDGAFIGYGIYSAYTGGTLDVYVYRLDGAWDPDLVTRGLELLVAAVFEQASADRVFTYLPVPFPDEGAEELLFDLGFDPWHNNRERGVKRTYAIERATWIAYHPEN